MSDILRRIITRFEAQPGNVRAVLGGMSSGYERAGMSARNMAREQSLLNNQLRAFGTTVRYAIAGGAVFGATGTISTLSQIQEQLGMISAIGSVSSPEGKGLLLVGDRLERLSQQTRQAAIDTMQPINDMNDAVISFFSTVRNAPENEVVPMVTDIAKAAKLSQITTEDATKSFLAMQTAFGRPINRRNVQATAQEFAMMIARVPGGPAAGAQIIQQFGQLAAVSRGGRISQAQLFGLITAGLRTGIPPSQFGRGLQFMIQTATRQRPLTKDAAAAMDALGITPDFVQTNPGGGMAAIMRIIRAVRERGGVGGNIRGQIQTLAATEEQIGPEADIPKALISGAGGQLAANIFRRVHEYRTFLALYQRATQARGGIEDPTLRQEIQDMIDAEHGHVRDQERLTDMWNRLQQQAPLKKAAVATQVLGQDILDAFAPIINIGARGISGLGTLATQHEDFTRGLTYATGLALLFAGGRRFLSRGLGRAGAVGTLVQGFEGAQGQWKGIPGESPQHPSFVWVMGTGLKFGSGQSPIPIPGAPGEPGVPGQAGRMGRFGNLGRNALRLAGWAGVGIMAAELLKYGSDKLPHWGALPEQEMAKRNRIFLGTRDAAKYWYDPNTRKFTLTQEGAKLGLSERATARSLGISQAALEQRIAQGGVQKVVGHAKVDVDVNVKQPDGTTTVKKTGVDLSLFNAFNDAPLRAPTSRGNARTSRG